ncbi:MAG: orotidine-5'-phosphate decarboxylase [Bdellovibrionota bacterium]
MFDTLFLERAKNVKSLLCIGLDPNVQFIKEQTGLSVYDFNKKVVDHTIDLALSFKPQIAHYSALGLEKDLEKTIEYIRSRNDKVPIILDAKRGDIGSTAEMYAKEAYERYAVDAVTVNPYLGIDSILPYLKYSEKGIIVLAKTSNKKAHPTYKILFLKVFLTFNIS